jgi:hypothetical protein
VEGAPSTGTSGRCGASIVRAGVSRAEGCALGCSTPGSPVGLAARSVEALKEYTSLAVTSWLVVPEKELVREFENAL